MTATSWSAVVRAVRGCSRYSQGGARCVLPIGRHANVRIRLGLIPMRGCDKWRQRAKRQCQQHNAFQQNRNACPLTRDDVALSANGQALLLSKSITCTAGCPPGDPSGSHGPSRISPAPVSLSPFPLKSSPAVLRAKCEVRSDGYGCQARPAGWQPRHRTRAARRAPRPPGASTSCRSSRCRSCCD